MIACILTGKVIIIEYIFKVNSGITLYELALSSPPFCSPDKQRLLVSTRQHCVLQAGREECRKRNILNSLCPATTVPLGFSINLFRGREEERQEDAV